MKYIKIFILLMVCCMFFSGCGNAIDNQSYLRIHIRANSNSEEDQSVKYKVKSAIVDFITPYIVECQSKTDAINVVINTKSQMEQIADEILSENGFTYKSNVVIDEEFFPTRVYDGFVLESDFYDAIIINLGTGEGNNWWCVVYPPLCFKGETENIIYKSKILEIIENFFK